MNTRTSWTWNFIYKRAVTKCLIPHIFNDIFHSKVYIRVLKRHEKVLTQIMIDFHTQSELKGFQLKVSTMKDPTQYYTKSKGS